MMLPVLRSCADGEVATKEIIESLAREFNLTEEEKERLLPSGKQTRLSNRINWARTYLKQAGLIEFPNRGTFKITDIGLKVLENPPERITNNFLSQYDSFQEFKSRKNNRSSDAKGSAEEELEDTDQTPDEVLRAAHKSINDALAADLLSRVRKADPYFFEELIVELLVKMGYGGANEDAGRAIGKSGDDGVDGVIDQDPLGVDQIYIQAKRYREGNNIGAGAIRDFFGALNLKKAQKGIFFTTSNFSPSAIQTGKDLGMRIVLIDGLRLARLMIKYNVGCREEETIHLKKVDEEYFE